MILVTGGLLRMVEVGEILKAREVKAISSMGRDVTLGLGLALSAGFNTYKSQKAGSWS
jgi:hypothetical protein